MNDEVCPECGANCWPDVEPEDESPAAEELRRTYEGMERA